MFISFYIEIIQIYILQNSLQRLPLHIVINIYYHFYVVAI